MEIHIYWDVPNLGRFLENGRLCVVKPYVGVTEEEVYVIDKTTIVVEDRHNDNGFWYSIIHLSDDEVRKLIELLQRSLQHKEGQFYECIPSQTPVRSSNSVS